MSQQAIRVQLEPTGLEWTLSELEASVQASVRRFAEKTLRPVGAALDRLDPEQVIAPDSAYWAVLAEFATLIPQETVLQLPQLEQARLLAIAYEEMGWGCGSMAIAVGAGGLHGTVLMQNNRLDLALRYPNHALGCWAITEPDHGSDMLDASGGAIYPGARHGRANCVARIDGDHIVIQGQKSAWVSNGPTAQICALFCGFDDGSGDDSKRCVVLVPLDLPGVTRGKPLDKMGQRSLPQGEIFFEQVRVPRDHLIAGPEQYQAAEYAVLSEANAGMGLVWTGAARAAYEHALAYAQERRQGGVTLMRHQNVRHRIFHMFRKVEAARALARQVLIYNRTAPLPALQASIASKITATQTAFEVASEAVQMFGGNGVTRAYPVEKLLRDARAAMIEDGCNELLAIKGGTLLADPSVL
jgi:alkylation response protein AidB-like acyl-CoA dehydrogenase